MNITLGRRLDLYVGSFLCRLFSLFPNKCPEASEPPRRILIILLSEMGSLVLAYPMMKYLHERYPDAQFYGLLFQRNQEALNILDTIRKENILTIRDNSITNFLRDGISVVKRLRTLNVDVVVDCELFARISSIFSFLSNAPIKVGFHRYTQEGLYRGDFINQPVPYNPHLHISRQFLNLAYSIDLNTVPHGKHPIQNEKLKIPPNPFSKVETSAYSAKLECDFPRLKERRLVLLYPSGGILAIRAWPFENYCKLTRALIDEGYSVGIIGLALDKHLGHKISTLTDSDYCIDLTGYTKTIRELLLLLQQATILITNDGGPGQLSTIVATPTIIFFGPESPRLYAPLSPTAHCLYRQLACSPCLTAYNHRNSPCDGDNQCLKRITVDEVLDRVQQILAAPQ